jgi:hypothetical protein
MERNFFFLKKLVKFNFSLSLQLGRTQTRDFLNLRLTLSHFLTPSLSPFSHSLLSRNPLKLSNSTYTQKIFRTLLFISFFSNTLLNFLQYILLSLSHLLTLSLSQFLSWFVPLSFLTISFVVSFCLYLLLSFPKNSSIYNIPFFSSTLLSTYSAISLSLPLFL